MKPNKNFNSRPRPRSYEDLPLFLSVSETAAALGIGRNTAYTLIRSGKLKGIRVGHKIRISKDELKRITSTNDYEKEILR